MTFDHDGQALDLLATNFGEKAGVLFPLVAGYTPTKDESDAIDYLCAEWDYGYYSVKPVDL